MLIKINVLGALYVVNIRNPYEVCASYFKFMKSSLDRAIASAKVVTKKLKFYGQMNHKKLLLIRYEDIISRPFNVLKSLNQFLGLELNDFEINNIILKYSKENVKKLIKETELSIQSKIDKNLKFDPNDIVKISENNIRYFNQNTGFQSDHISNQSSSNWKDLFNDYEIKKITENLKNDVSFLGY